jgi:predicted nucleic acid-binding protein
MVIVDTSVWIEAARRDGDLGHKVGLANLLDAYEAGLCSPVRLEFLGGARALERPQLSFWLEAVPCLEIKERHWDLAKEHSWRLRDQGHTIPWNDLLVASLALDLDCRTYAKDTHFDTMAEVIGLRLYVPGYGGRFEPDGR